MSSCFLQIEIKTIDFFQEIIFVDENIAFQRIHCNTPPEFERFNCSIKLIQSFRLRPPAWGCAGVSAP